MSDMPDNYFVNGVELVNFRREPDLSFLGLNSSGKAVKKKKKKSRSMGPYRPHLVERDGSRCHYCDCLMSPPVGSKAQDNTMTVEHVVPRSNGGKNALFNLVLACSKCNNNFGSQHLKCYCAFCGNARLQHLGTKRRGRNAYTVYDSPRL